MDHISEGSESDEDYNLRNFGIYQALPVEGEPDWSLGGLVVQAATQCNRSSRRLPERTKAYEAVHTSCGNATAAEEPDSAEEYLRRVRHEAARCARVSLTQWDLTALHVSRSASPVACQGHMNQLQGANGARRGWLFGI